MLSLWNPFLPVVKTNSDSRISPKTYVDRLFEDSFNTMFRDLLAFSPPTNLVYKKSEDGVMLVSVDVPGIKEEDITIEVKDNIVNISGETKTDQSYRKVNQSFSIPEGYDAGEVKAELANGVLTLTLPSKPKPQPEVKKIAITSKK